jgi:hypothetical protein
MLRGYVPRTEVRERGAGGEVLVQTEPAEEEQSEPPARGTYREESRRAATAPQDGRKRNVIRIFPYAISRERLERAIHDLRVPAYITNEVAEADMLLTLKSHAKRQSQKIREARGHNVEVHVVRSNTLKQMENFLREVFHAGDYLGGEDSALREVEDAVVEVMERRRPVELTPQPKHIRRMQHIYVERSGLLSESKGQEPMRRVVIYPHR